MCDLLAECLFSPLPVSVPVFQFWHLVWVNTLSLSLEASSNKHSFELNILVVHGWHTSLFENIASFCQTLIFGSNYWLTRFDPRANSKWSMGQLKMIRGPTRMDPWANSKWSVGQLKMIRGPTRNDPWANSKWSVGQLKMIRGPTQNDPWANAKWSVGQLKMIRGPTELFWHNPGGKVSPVFLK